MRRARFTDINFRYGTEAEYVISNVPTVLFQHVTGYLKVHCLEWNVPVPIIIATIGVLSLMPLIPTPCCQWPALTLSGTQILGVCKICSKR